MAICSTESLAGNRLSTAPAIARDARKARRTTFAGWRAALSAAFERLVRAPLHRWRVARRLRREVEMLDERMLRDIGLIRGETGDLTRLGGQRTPHGLHLGPRYDHVDIAAGRIFPHVP